MVTVYAIGKFTISAALRAAWPGAFPERLAVHPDADGDRFYLAPDADGARVSEHTTTGGQLTAVRAARLVTHGLPIRRFDATVTGDGVILCTAQQGGPR
jgi:hypothetical protein